MNTAFKLSEKVRSKLVTPEVPTSSGCLVFDVMFIASDDGGNVRGVLEIYAINKSAEILILYETLHPEFIWMELEASLLTGNYQILFVFCAEGTNPDTEGMLWLADVRVNNNSCTNSHGKPILN